RVFKRDSRGNRSLYRLTEQEVCQSMSEQEKKHVLATVSMQVVFDKQQNLARYFYYLDRAFEVGARLLVLPEQSLQGYLHNVAELRMETLAYQHAHAEKV